VAESFAADLQVEDSPMVTDRSRFLKKGRLAWLIIFGDFAMEFAVQNREYFYPKISGSNFWFKIFQAF